ncbi:hypothetical protein [Burkholderia multivorans]|uniref:hypothetical protein n=1 Tax=Burkholderia multivorans TaxID=87883 RepID=UPI0018DE0AC6|nr:hypothetical protein [Burkholderia multivorans]MBH9661030.1 hypothetical protein [Burkholderia multivorans]
MAKYAVFDSSKSAPYPVIAWLDTDFVSYPQYEGRRNLVEMTEEQWSAHLVRTGGWTVSGGKLIAPKE